MNCQKCSEEKELFAGKLCASCLLIVLEKRIKKSIREQGGFNKNENILFVLDDSVESSVAKYFFNRIYSKIPLKVDFEKKCEHYNKIVLPWTSEKLIDSFLNSLFSNQKFECPNSINFLESLTVEEINDVAKIKNLTGKKLSYNLLDKIEQKYPGSKFSLLKSIKVLEMD